jgi:hypothetical protein
MAFWEARCQLLTSRLLARYGLPTLYEWRVKPTEILVTYDGLSNAASPLGLPVALGRE